jgi:hypothetical protein
MQTRFNIRRKAKDTAGYGSFGKIGNKGETVHTFEPELTDLQRQVLTLLGVPETVYHVGL